ncbi:MAG: hypothetical protein WC565_02055 [Parcubacteria group bacterium]
MEAKKRLTKSAEAKDTVLENAKALNDLKSTLFTMQDLAERYVKAIRRVKVMETVKGIRQALKDMAAISKEFAELSDKAYEMSGLKCAYCGGPAQGNYSLHRDGFCVGPEVDLCDNCGSGVTPSCEQIWDQIAVRKDRPHKTKKALKADARLEKRFTDANSKINHLLQGLGQ